MTASLKRRTVARTLLALVAVVGLSAGCVGQRTPGGYGDSVEENFVRGCTTTTNDDGEGGSFDVGAFCQCAYDELSGDNGVPFDDFKSVVDDQTENPGPLPDSFTSTYASCTDEANGTAETAGG